MTPQTFSITGSCVRVLHVPCNTPYVRKLQKIGSFEITNGRMLAGGATVPLEITYRWILERDANCEFWSCFDVCHVHYGFEFEEVKIVRDALQLLKRHRKAIVFTCHELHSVHGITQELYKEYLTLILHHADEVLTLTDWARDTLISSYPNVPTPTVIPHGYVIPPERLEALERKTDHVNPELLLFGALRSNRDVATTLANLSLDTTLGCRVTLVTRPFSKEQLSDSSVLRTALELSSNNPNIRVELTLPLSDEEVAMRVAKADVLILPYLSGGHSGQLELAYDCGVLPVTTNVGFFAQQCAFWPAEGNKKPTALIVDWMDGKNWLYQSRFISAVRDALRMVPTYRQSLDVEARKLFRLSEHQRLLDKHFSVYSRALSAERGGRYGGT